MTRRPRALLVGLFAILILLTAVRCSEGPEPPSGDGQNIRTQTASPTP